LSFHEQLLLLMVGIQNIAWSGIRKNWTSLTQIATGVMAVVATIVTPPPTPVGAQGIRPFATFFVAILAGIFMLALRRFRKQEHASLWATVTAILLVLTVWDYFWYAHLIDTRTENWHERTIIYGTELQPEVKKAYPSTISKHLVRELLEDAAGDPQLIWTDRSIRWSKDILCISYLALVPLIGGCIIATSQIAICVALRQSSKKSNKGHKKNSAIGSP
jgi:hypothetical protein